MSLPHRAEECGGPVVRERTAVERKATATMPGSGNKQNSASHITGSDLRAGGRALARGSAIEGHDGFQACILKG